MRRRRTRTSSTAVRKRTRSSNRLRKGGTAKRARAANLGEHMNGFHYKTRLAIDEKSKNYDARVVYLFDTTICPLEPGGSRTGRTFSRINCYGIRVQAALQSMQVDTLPVTTYSPWVVNFALVVRKDQADSLPNSNNFFRDHSADSQVDFSIGLSGYEISNNSINGDKYNVLWRRKYFISGKRAANDQQPRQYLSFDKYFPIKRQLDYADGTGTSCREKIVLLMWFDTEFSAVGQAVRTACMAGDIYSSLIFRDMQA